MTSKTHRGDDSLTVSGVAQADAAQLSIVDVSTRRSAAPVFTSCTPIEMSSHLFLLSLLISFRAGDAHWQFHFSRRSNGRSGLQER
jgi:hypothetical protein